MFYPCSDSGRRPWCSVLHTRRGNQVLLCARQLYRPRCCDLRNSIVIFVGRPAYESTQPGESEQVWSDPQSRLGRSPKLANLKKKSHTCIHPSPKCTPTPPRGQMESRRSKKTRRNNCRSTYLGPLGSRRTAGSLISGEVRFGGERAGVFRVHVVQGSGNWGDSGD